MGELEELASYCEDGVKTVDGMACRVFDGGKLLMPLAGACDTLGSIGFKQTNGGYWGSGRGRGGSRLGHDARDRRFLRVRALQPDRFVGFSALRAQRGRSALCVSYSDRAADLRGFRTDVTCQSELDEFEVMVACEEEQFVEKAGKDRLTVSFDIPANDGTEDRVYKIYVNDDYTGQSVTQTYKAGVCFVRVAFARRTCSGRCVRLDRHLQERYGRVSRCTSGRGRRSDANGIEIRSGGDFLRTGQYGAEARELKIFVGGADCGKSVVQQSKYTDVAVGQTTWARGNVVLEGGQFAIGAPTDYGLYFKFNSTYGMPYDPGAAYYQGTAYNPNPVTIGWKDMAADAGGDPCRLVAPADTWRLPTRSETRR